MNLNHRISTAACKAIIAVAAVGISMLSNSANAQTLEEIKARKKLVVGIQVENYGWGFVNAKGENVGVDADVARLLGKELEVSIQFVPVTNNNRIAALQASRVDVLIASVGMLPERAKAVQFSQPYGVIETMVVAAKSTPIQSMADLAKLKVGVPRGAITDTQLSAGAPAGTEILRLDDDSFNIQGLISGQVEAIGATTMHLARLNELSPGKYEKKFVLQALYYGAATRMGDKELNSYINSFIEKYKANGTLAQIYKKNTGLHLPELATSIEGVPFAAR